MNLDKWIDLVFSANFIATLALAGIWVAFRTLALRWASLTALWEGEGREKAKSSIRIGFLIALFTGFLLIWGPATGKVVASIFVFLSAVGFAVKELLASFSGSLYRMRAKTYGLGDRITIGSHRGDVVDLNLISTTLLEVGPGPCGTQQTGRKITFSNSRLLSQFVINETLIEQFNYHVIEIPLKRTENWKLAKQILSDSATKQAASFIDAARRKLTEVEKERSAAMPSVDPRVWIELGDEETLILKLRMAMPIQMRERIEQAVTDEFLEKFYPIKPLEEVLGRTISSN